MEDEHSYANVVVNFFDGVAGAALARLQTNGDPAGSTIAQQLAKQIYGHGTGLSASLREVALGMKLSLTYSPPWILAMYLNAVYYGNHYWGDVAAARGYFGLAPGPPRLGPGRDPGRPSSATFRLRPPAPPRPVKQRQLQVLNQLVVNHDLTRAQAQAAFREPLKLRGKAVS